VAPSLRADMALPKHPQSLLRFLAVWAASYVAAFLLTAVALALLLLAHIVRDADSAATAGAIMWLSVFPASLALGQWLIMRRHVRNALPWAAATLTAGLLSQLGNQLVPEVARADDFPGLIVIVDVLRPIVGLAIAFDVLQVLPNALCFGAAWSLPQALAFPGSWSARFVWVSALMLTSLVVVVMAKSLSRELLMAFIRYQVGFWMPTLVSHVLPAILGWVILSLVGGSIMYWSLRRGSPMAISQLYARFD
jgi:hypothetical protein